MRPSTILLTVCVGTAAISVPRFAMAADPTELSVEANALTAKAGALYDEGRALYQKGQLAAARASYLAAWSLKKHWQIAANLADTEIQLGKLRDAAEHAAYYLRNAPADRHARGDALLAKAQAGVGTLTVHVDQAGAEVLVDGQAVGTSPLEAPVFVEPGHHTIEARIGSRFASIAADAPAGARQDVVLAPKESSTPPLRDGPSLPVIITGSGITAAALVAGTVLAVVAHGKASDASTLLATLPPAAAASPCQANANTCATINSDRHARDTLSDASMGAFIGAGAVGLATLGYALFTPKQQQSSGLKVAPLVGSGRGGFVVMGTW